MSQIKPFKSVCYDPQRVENIAQVFCPPYDVISTEEKIRLHNTHPFNFIRILLGQEKATDDRYNNKYTRAKKLYEDWLKKGILKEDPNPGFYFYKQEYIVHGQKFNRVGFIGLLKLQDKHDSKIFPHENTHTKAKEDRLRLWRNIKSNCSPIFVCFSDREKKVENIFVQKISIHPPFVDLTDSDQVRHTIWRLDDLALIEEIKAVINGQHLFIADGHHRYEVALEYRRMKLRNKTRSNGQEPFNYVMTYFTNLDSKDLLILPIHRVIRKMRGKLEFLNEYFRTDKIGTKEDLLILLKRAGQNEHAFGMYSQEGIRLLRLKSKLLIDQHIKEGSKQYRRLDATILKTFVFDRLGIGSDDIIYSKDAAESFNMVETRQADACFILNPVKMQQLKDVALNGERMPPKTTYFYPKVLSGVTLYRLE